jgi:hypothetical protein
MRTTTKCWIGIAALVVLSPLGILIPGYFKAGSAWGEWGSHEMQQLAGYVPKGLEKLSGLWKAPMPEYALKGAGEKGLFHTSFSYILSAVVGIVIVVAVVFLIGKMLAKKGE